MVSLLTSIITNWKIILISSLILLSIGLCLYIRMLQAEKAVLTVQVQAAQINIQILRASLKAQNEALQQRAQDQAGVEIERQEEVKKFDETIKNNPEVCDWANQPVPNDILNLLCQAN
jgi:hypothetical protein